MALPVQEATGFDPNIMTGAVRGLFGPLYYAPITTNQPYTTTNMPDNQFARWLYVGTTGDVSVVRWDGVSILIPNLASGVWHPIPTMRVNTTSTTATGLLWGN